jgi:outer membrane protein OmpA-like peptidoglycan-associated protein
MLRRSPKYAFLSLVALIAWLSAGSYWVAENCCGSSLSSNVILTEEVPKVPLLIQDAGFFSIQSEQSIVFGFNDARPVLYEDVSKNLMKVIEYIKSNPLKRVRVLGLYDKDESKGLDLARNRADSILKILIRAGVPKYQISAQSGQNDALIKDKKHQIVFNAVRFSFSCIAPFLAQDLAHDFLLQADDNFIFRHGTASLLLKINDTRDSLLQQIAVYLNEYPDRKLILTGYSHPEEQISLGFDNLGMARANFIRSKLMEAGALGQQIEIIGKEDVRIAVVDNDLFGQLLPNPMAYRFEFFSALNKKQLLSKKRAIERMLKEIQVFRFKNLRQDSFMVILDARTKAYISDLASYLALNPKAKVYCVGHSNKTASDSLDFTRASERAVYIFKFLKSHGISSSRLEINSAGSTHPLGKSTTQYGQEINRRVDVFVSLTGKVPKLYVFPPKTTKKRKKRKKRRKPPVASKPKEVNIIQPSLDSVFTKVDTIKVPLLLRDSVFKPLVSDTSVLIGPKPRDLPVVQDTL